MWGWALRHKCSPASSQFATKTHRKLLVLSVLLVDAAGAVSESGIDGRPVLLPV